MQIVGKALLWSFVSTILGACASVHPGILGKQTTNNSDMNLVVSAQVERDYSDDAHRYIDFTIENKGYGWEKIEKIEFQYGEPDQLDYEVLKGKDLKVWAEAFVLRAEMEEYNKSVALTALMSAGFAAAVASDDPNTKRAGTYLMGGTAIAGQLMAKNTSGKSVLERSQHVPETHLLGDYSIPANMWIRRWILVNVPGDDWAKNTYITITTVDGKQESFEIPIIQ